MACDGREIALLALAERSSDGGLPNANANAAELAAQIRIFVAQLPLVETVREALRRQLQQQVRATRQVSEGYGFSAGTQGLLLSMSRG